MAWGGTQTALFGGNYIPPAQNTGQSGSASTSGAAHGGTAWGGASQVYNPGSGVSFDTNSYSSTGEKLDRSGDISDPKNFANYYIRPGANQAQSYLNNEVGYTPFAGNRVADLSETQQDYLSQSRQFGNTVPAYMQSSENAVNSVANNSGMTPGMQGQIGTLSGISSGGNRVADHFAGINTSGPSYAQQNLAGMAAGDQINGGNPYFQEALSNQLADIQSRVNSQFSGAGRYGSGAQTEVLADQLGQVATGALSQNYENERARQMQANQMLDQNRQFGINAGFARAQGMTGTAQQNISNQANAANSVLAAQQVAQQDGLRAAAMAPQFQQAQLQRINQLNQAGALEQSQNQDKINAEMDLFNETQAAPWQRLNAYMSTIGAGGMPSGGGSVQTPQQPQQQGPSTAQSVLGGAMTGASIGGMFGQPALGAIGGGLLGLF